MLLNDSDSFQDIEIITAPVQHQERHSRPCLADVLFVASTMEVVQFGAWKLSQYISGVVYHPGVSASAHFGPVNVSEHGLY